MPSKSKLPKTVTHHIIYSLEGTSHKQKPVTVVVYSTEHWILSQLQRRGSLISKGFLRALQHFIWLHDEDALILRPNDTCAIPISEDSADTEINGA